MDEVRSTPAAQRENQSQIRRAQLGVVAATSTRWRSGTAHIVGNIRETGPSGDAPRVHLAVTCAVGRGLPASRGRATRAHRE